MLHVSQVTSGVIGIVVEKVTGSDVYHAYRTTLVHIRYVRERVIDEGGPNVRSVVSPVQERSNGRGMSSER